MERNWLVHLLSDFSCTKLHVLTPKDEHGRQKRQGSRGVLGHRLCEAFGVMRLGSEKPHLEMQRENNS